MKIISYNVNGLRSALTKGLLEWVKAADPDCLCLQEIKSNEDQVDLTGFTSLGYHCYLHSAEKKGYSGVAIFSKIKPNHIEIGCGNSKYDMEGRIIRVDFEDFSLMNVYLPSGTMGDIRQQYKYELLDDFYTFISDLKNKLPQMVIVGDYNICHKPIDIHNPVSNAKSSGFLPAEREWMGKFLEMGFIDTFRHFNKEPHNYTWWSLRFAARDRNLGWRIDYQVVTQEMKDRLKRALILPEARHSDHCPTFLEIN